MKYKVTKTEKRYVTHEVEVEANSPEDAEMMVVDDMEDDEMKEIADETDEVWIEVEEIHE